jgi:hypothetical protein
MNECACSAERAASAAELAETRMANAALEQTSLRSVPTLHKEDVRQNA